MCIGGMRVEWTRIGPCLGTSIHEIGALLLLSTHRLVKRLSVPVQRELFGDPDADYSRRWIGITVAARRKLGTALSRRMRPCASGGPFKLITCISRRPGHRGLVRPGTGVGSLRPTGVGPQRHNTIIDKWLPLSWSRAWSIAR